MREGRGTFGGRRMGREKEVEIRRSAKKEKEL